MSTTTTMLALLKINLLKTRTRHVQCKDDDHKLVSFPCTSNTFLLSISSRTRNRRQTVHVMNFSHCVHYLLTQPESRKAIVMRKKIELNPGKHL